MALPKLFQRIFFHNDTTPALNEDNLNAISKGLDDLDDRVIDLGGAVLETVPQIQEYLSQADDLVDELEALTTNPPYIGQNGHWYTWDTDTGAYVDSGVDASITVSVGTTSTLSPGSNATVENVGTDTDPILNFGIPQGQTGQPGDDGVSPEVTVTTISGGHRVTITDADHPTGQSFDVMDGAGNGDMTKAVYDDDNAVANAGGIADYVSGQTSGKLDKYSSGSADWDTAPTQSSDKAITSGGVYTNTLRSISSLTSTDDGNTKLQYIKGALGYNVVMGVTGWDKLVGKWTTPVSVTSTATSVNLTNPYGVTSVDVDPYCERSSGKPVTIKTMSVTASTITLTFDALGEAGSFKAKVTLNS